MVLLRPAPDLAAACAEPGEAILVDARLGVDDCGRGMNSRTLDGSLWLQRLDPQELARRIREELHGIDLAPLVAKVEAEIDALAASKYPSAARR